MASDPKGVLMHPWKRLPRDLLHPLGLMPFIHLIQPPLRLMLTPPRRKSDSGVPMGWCCVILPLELVKGGEATERGGVG
jgi:hypothetical protein